MYEFVMVALQEVCVLLSSVYISYHYYILNILGYYLD